MTGKPKVQEIVEKASSLAGFMLNKEFDSVISMNKYEEGWLAEVEVLERKSVPDTQDILGRYEMKFDDGGELLGYKRIMLRRRSDMEMVQEEV
jgi:hypothetical protein